MSNTDGEDTQRKRTIDVSSQPKYYQLANERDKELASLRDQLEIERNKVGIWIKELQFCQNLLKQKDQRIKFVEELLNEDLHEENKSLKSKLKQQEEVIRKLIPLARMFVVHKEWMGEECKTEKAIIEKAKSLTTKDK